MATCPRTTLASMGRAMFQSGWNKTQGLEYERCRSLQINDARIPSKSTLGSPRIILDALGSSEEVQVCR